MLVLTRKVGEQIQIGDDITITVTRVDVNTVKIGIVAPSAMTVLREELTDGASQQHVQLAAAVE